MSERFRVTISNTNAVSFVDVVGNTQLMSITFKNKSDAVDCRNALLFQCDLLNSLHEENEYHKRRLKEVLKELYCKDRVLEEKGISVECCDKNE